MRVDISSLKSIEVKEATPLPKVCILFDRPPGSTIEYNLQLVANAWVARLITYLLSYGLVKPTCLLSQTWISKPWILWCEVASYNLRYLYLKI